MGCKKRERTGEGKIGQTQSNPSLFPLSFSLKERETHTHTYMAYWHWALCATGSLYERWVLSTYHSTYTQPIIIVLYVQQYNLWKMSTEHVPLHTQTHNLLPMCFMCNRIALWKISTEHIPLCTQTHNLLSLCFVCNRISLWKTSTEHVPLCTQPIITVLYVQQYHFMKDECRACTTPHTNTQLSALFLCNRITLWKRSTEHVPLLRFGERGVSQRVVRVILKGNTSCRVPLGVLLGKTFPGKGPNLQLLPFAQFADENVWWAEQKLVVKKSSDVYDKASAFSKDWPDKALTSSNNIFFSKPTFFETLAESDRPCLFCLSKWAELSGWMWQTLFALLA